MEAALIGLGATFVGSLGGVIADRIRVGRRLANLEQRVADMDERGPMTPAKGVAERFARLETRVAELERRRRF
jgi:hypothetical protein